jgi:hypothetical protein
MQERMRVYEQEVAFMEKQIEPQSNDRFGREIMIKNKVKFRPNTDDRDDYCPILGSTSV